MAFQPSPQQSGYFNWVRTGVGSAVLEAVAGSGKTTTLVEGLKLMSGLIFFGAYNKDIALEIAHRAGQREGLFVGTMHSAGFRVWRGFAKNVKVENKKVRNIFRSASSRNPSYVPFEGAVLELVSYAKQAAFGVTHNINSSEEWMRLVDHFGIDCLGEEALVCKLARKTLLESVKLNAVEIDFDDMIYAPLCVDLFLEVIGVEAAKKFPRKANFFKHDWVLIDEAQDTNEARRLLALAMLKPNGRLVAVGDRKQAIYGFTGADADALDLIAQATNAVLLPLTITYRCPKAVVAEAQKYVKHIEAAETAPQGKVAELAYAELANTIKVGDVVLSRFNAPNVRIAYTLIGKGIPAKILGRQIGEGLEKLTKRLKAKDFDSFYSKLAEWEEKEVAKLMAKEKEVQAEAVADQCACLRVIADRALNAQGANRTASVTEMICKEIVSIFSDEEGKPVVTLSSIHKAKGKEWNRVFWLQTGPAKMAKLPWELEQENNLMYVAATRSKDELFLLEPPPKA